MLIRISTAISTIIVLIIALYTLAVNTIEYDKSIELDGNIYFTGKVLGSNVIGIKSNSGLLGTRLFDSNNGAPFRILKAYNGQKEYITAFGTDEINIYTKDGAMKKLNLEYPYIKDACASDLDGDKNYELLILVSETPKEYADEMIILSVDTMDGKDSGIKEVYKFKCSDLNPWKIQTADIDGDGTVEISLGVYKTAPFHPEMAKRPFIYNWTSSDGMFPKWRGSRLSRPFDDYIFGNIEAGGIDDIISVETRADSKKVLTSYIWKGFGFEKTAESEGFEYISELASRGKEIEAKFKEKGITYWGVFEFKEGKLVLVNKSIKSIGNREE